MEIKEIKELLKESKCKNMLLSVLRRIRYMGFARKSIANPELFDSNRAISIGIDNFSHSIHFTFDNFEMLYLPPIPIHEVQSIWLKFSNPKQLADIIQKLIQPYNGEIRVIGTGATTIHLRMEYDPNFALKDTNLYLAFEELFTEGYFNYGN
jgi:hypothetical protein